MKNALLTDDDILDYLMTSEFNEGLTQEEAKFLLLKYRYYYRLSHSKQSRLKEEIEDLNSQIKEIKLDLESANKSIKDLGVQLEAEKNRKLSWKERLYGIKNKK